MSAIAYTGPGTDLKPDQETVHAFVDWWFEPCGHGRVEIGWMDAGGAGLIHHRRFGLSAVNELAAVAARMNLVPGQSVYVRPATVATPAGEVTTDRHFCQAPGPWSDLDTPEQVERARGVVQTLLRPNGLVRTGLVPHERLQQFFRCAEPITSAEMLRSFNNGLTALYGGDTAVTNPTSYMRLPGTIAWPLKAGRVPELTAFIRPDGVQDAYALAMVASLLPQGEQRPVRPARAGDAIERGDGTTDGYGRAALDEECERIRRAVPGEQNNTLFAAACAIGELIAGGHIEPDEGREALVEAGMAMVNAAGADPWTPQRVKTLVTRGIARGAQHPRGPERETADVDISGFLASVARPAAAPGQEAEPSEAAAERYDPLAERALSAGVMDVDGALQQFVEWNVASAVSPQPFLSLGAAMCMVGTLAGRRYRGPTGLRTNLYAVAIADSGAGKEHPRQGLKKAFTAANMLEYLGDNLASGPAIATSLAASPSRLYLMDEFGKELGKWTAERAPAYLADVWAKLTGLYTEDLFLGPEYADQKARPRVTVPLPALSLYASTVPEPFWAALRQGSLRDGSVARLPVFLTPEDYPARNRRPAPDKVPDDLVAHMRAIDAGAEGHDYGGNLALQPGATPNLYQVRANGMAGELLEALQDD